MNKLFRGVITLAAAGALAIAPISGAMAYPSATGNVVHAAVQVKTFSSGATYLALSGYGVSDYNGTKLANKSLAVFLKLPTGARVSVGSVRTDSHGRYSLNIKNRVAKPGVYKVYVIYRGQSTVVTITI